MTLREEIYEVYADLLYQADLASMMGMHAIAKAINDKAKAIKIEHKL